MPHRTQIAGEHVSPEGIVLIRPFTEFSIIDPASLSFVPQAIVHIRHKGQRAAKRNVRELASALGFVTLAACGDVVAVNPAFAHYSISAVQEEERTRKGQQTKIAWKVNGHERSVYVKTPIAEVLALLPKAAEHQFRTEVLAAGRPHVVRDVTPTEPGTDLK